MTRQAERNRTWAKSLLAGGDCCGLCEHWQFVVQGQGGAPAVGDCCREWDETLRFATAKPCPSFVRDSVVERMAKGEKVKK